MLDFANQQGALLGFGYAYGNVIEGVWEVVLAAAAEAPAVRVAIEAIMLASAGDGPIDIFAFSGGAGAFNAALRYLPASVKDRIRNVTYLAPGSAEFLSFGSGARTLVVGNGDSWEMVISPPLLDAVNLIRADCPHALDCMMEKARSALDELAGGGACRHPGVIVGYREDGLSPVSYNSSFYPTLPPYGTLPDHFWRSIFQSLQTTTFVSSTITFTGVLQW